MNMKWKIICSCLNLDIHWMCLTLQNKTIENLYHLRILYVLLLSLQKDLSSYTLKVNTVSYCVSVEVHWNWNIQVKANCTNFPGHFISGIICINNVQCEWVEFLSISAITRLSWTRWERWFSFQCAKLNKLSQLSIFSTQVLTGEDMKIYENTMDNALI